MSIALKLYLKAAGLADWPVRRLLRKRAKRGKEDPERLSERLGQPGRDRPEGPLIWLHAASVGESLSVLSVIKEISSAKPGMNFLVTTGTVTSAQLMAERLPRRAIHQYAPVDLISAIRPFLKHWRPDLCIRIESEFWPATLTEIKAAGIKLALINARISEHSATRWRRAPGMIRQLTSSFDLVLAQSPASADRLIQLGALEDRVFPIGNLKEAAERLPFDPDELTRLNTLIGDRPRWLAASTHEPEEMTVIETYRVLMDRVPNLLTIIAPRHPDRGGEIARMLDNTGIRYRRRALGEAPDADTEIYLADTLGELGLWYRLSPVAFLGGSLAHKGGHNPFEPASLRTGVLHGPHVDNFAHEYDRLTQAGAAVMVDGSLAMTAALNDLFTENGDPTEAARKMAAAAVMLAMDGAKVMAQMAERLGPLLPDAPKLPDLQAADAAPPGDGGD